MYSTHTWIDNCQRRRLSLCFCFISMSPQLRLSICCLTTHESKLKAPRAHVFYLNTMTVYTSAAIWGQAYFNPEGQHSSMSIGLAVSSGASGPLLDYHSGLLGTTVAETTTGASDSELPRRASEAGKYDLRCLIGVVLTALAVFSCGYGCGPWARTPSRGRERVGPRVLDGGSLARGTHRSPVPGRPELRAREDTRVAGERYGLADPDAA